MRRIFNFLNQNQGAIQAILVFVLVCVTIWYAISSRQMASIMQQEYGLNTIPYVFLGRTVDRNTDPQDNRILQLVFHFTNSGKVPVEYSIEELTIEKASINPEKVNTILFPNQEGTLTSNLYRSESVVYPCDGLAGSIKFIFWAHGVPEEKYYFRRNFALASQMHTFIMSEDFGRVKSR